MTVNPNRLGDLLHQQSYDTSQISRPTSASVDSYNAGSLYVNIPSFDNGVHSFGPVAAPSNLTLSPGDGVLVISDETGVLWLIGQT